MTREEVIDFISKSLTTKNGVITSKKEGVITEHIRLNIIKYTQFLDDNFPIIFRAKALILGESTQKICTNCSKKIPYSNKYFIKEFCSKNCVAKWRNSNEESKLKTSITNINKYGVDNPFKSKELMQNSRELRDNKIIGLKISKTLKDNYKNIENHSSKKYLKNEHLFTKEYLLDNFVNNNEFNIEESMRFFNCSMTTINNFKRNNNILILNKTTTLSIEKEINSIFNNVFTIKDRTLIKPKEIDLYNDECKLAIEYNGMMYHSIGNYEKGRIKNKNINYHLEKTEMAENKGVNLLHIFEIEWNNPIKQDIWISIINNKLKLNDRIFARKTIVKEISNIEAKNFLEENHIQGNCMSKIKIGLFYKNSLISVMTLGKSRFNKNYDYELIRFCNKKYINVIGGASKLLKYFERKYNPKSIISYANRRWSQGNLYEKLGFTEINKTKPNYFYFTYKSKVLESRNKYQKHKLKDKLEIYDESLSESENMFNNGYRQIYDSGNIVFLKTYKKEINGY